MRYLTLHSILHTLIKTSEIKNKKETKKKRPRRQRENQAIKLQLQPTGHFSSMYNDALLFTHPCLILKNKKEDSIKITIPTLIRPRQTVCHSQQSMAEQRSCHPKPLKIYFTRQLDASCTVDHDMKFKTMYVLKRNIYSEPNLTYLPPVQLVCPYLLQSLPSKKDRLDRRMCEV